MKWRFERVYIYTEITTGNVREVFEQQPRVHRSTCIYIMYNIFKGRDTGI